MLPDNLLRVYPTHRAIREAIARQKDALLPKMATIGEFEQRSVVLPERTFIDDDTRLLLLREACDFEAFHTLGIEREFFAFLKNSAFVFGFFDELALEGVEITDLSLADTYAEYQEHLQILEEVLRRYHALLERKGYTDRTLFPKEFEINGSYIAQFDRIEIFQEGYFSRFEFELFDRIARIKPLYIHLRNTPYTQKMAQRYREYGIALEQERSYLIDFSNKRVLDTHPLSQERPSLHIAACGSRVEQVGFVKKRIFDYLEAGIAPEEILVVLPRKEFAEQLRLFDDEKNLNFAMGFPFAQSKIYRKIEARLDYYQERSIENRMRLQRLGIDPDTSIEEMKEWHRSKTPEEIVALLQEWEKEEASEEVQIYQEELFLFRRLLPHLAHYPVYKVLHLFASRLAQRSIDDVRGGKITVLEVLESRGITPQAVIIVDFNEDYVPARSRKDLFLSSALRKKVGMPTVQDREMLQKYYYHTLIMGAREVSISYTRSDTAQPSRFLEEMGLMAKEQTPEYNTILFRPKEQRPHFLPEELVLEYDFREIALSSSRLKMFLECKRRYYLHYIAGIKEAQIPTQERDEREMGVLIHGALQRLYLHRQAYESEERLLEDLRKELYTQVREEGPFKFGVDLWMKRLERFAKREIERFREGYRIVALEREMERIFKGFRISGKIDRIDEKEGRWYVTDYKTGKIQNAKKRTPSKYTDFQLQFYYLLARSEHEDVVCDYYDLKEGKKVEEADFELKLALLEEKLELLKPTRHNFTMTENLENCRYCPYTWICNKV